MSKELEALDRVTKLLTLLMLTGECPTLDDSALGKDLNTIETTLIDYEWLKNKINLTFLNNLSDPEDKMRIMKIMGFEYGK